MKLISEVNDQLEYIIESVDNKPKNYFIEGQWATADEKNRNGRIYPKQVLSKALKEYDEQYIKQKRSVCELGHPNTPTVNLDRVSHIIENLKMDGNIVTGRARVMDTPMGKIVKNLMDEGVKLGVSTRGLGSIVEKKGYNEVQDDFVINAIDIVSDPSGPGCWVEGIMDGAEWVFDVSSNSWKIAEQVKKSIMKMNSKELVEKQSLLFQQFLNNIK